jgi:hypothetical protein
MHAIIRNLISSETAINIYQATLYYGPYVYTSSQHEHVSFNSLLNVHIEALWHLQANNSRKYETDFIALFIISYYAKYVITIMLSNTHYDIPPPPPSPNLISTILSHGLPTFYVQER